LESLEPRRLLACQKVAYIVAGLGGVDYPLAVIDELIGRGFDVRTPWWNSTSPTDDRPEPIPNQPGRYNPYISYNDDNPGFLSVGLPDTSSLPAEMLMDLGAPNTSDVFVDAVVADLINNYDRDDLVILIGHGLGGDSVLRVAQRIAASGAPVDVDFLGLLDPMGTLDPADGPPGLLSDLETGEFFDPYIDMTQASGLIPTYLHTDGPGPLNSAGRITAWRGGLGVVPSSVRYFYNRWQTNAILPFDFFADGTLVSQATGNLQVDFGIGSQAIQNTTAIHSASDLEILFGLRDSSGFSTSQIDVDFPLNTTIQDELLSIVRGLDDQFGCLIVTTTADLVDGQPAQGSLRAAILTANQRPGPDTIVFDIRPRGTGYAIVLDTALPQITDPVTIDATTQPGYAGRPIVQINGLKAGVEDGLVARASNVVLRGLNIAGFRDAGIVFAAGSGHRVEGCWIGTDLSGRNALGNLDGIVVQGASKLFIGGPDAEAGNVISGNGRAGIRVIGGSSDGVEIVGNRIGTDPEGAAPVTRSGSTLLEQLQSAGISVESGGEVTIESNLVSGNYVGVMISGASAGITRVRNNRIGTNAAGMRAVPNVVGVYLNGTKGHQIGTTGAGNLISGNRSVGVEIFGDGSRANQIIGNTIGLAADGRSPVPNAEGLQPVGVYIEDASSNTIRGNLISGQSIAGIYILSRRGDASGNQITSNRIGLAATGRRGPGTGLYGALLYNAPDNLVPTRGSGANQFGPASIATIRDFRGPVPESESRLARRSKRLIRVPVRQRIGWVYSPRTGGIGATGLRPPK
jgi:parallel beta-helix repeat protein